LAVTKATRPTSVVVWKTALRMRVGENSFIASGVFSLGRFKMASHLPRRDPGGLKETKEK
jgi:hypothetical protein